MMSRMTATHATTPALMASEAGPGFTVVFALLVVAVCYVSYLSLRSKK